MKTSIMGIRRYRQLWEAQIAVDAELSSGARLAAAAIRDAHGRREQIVQFHPLRRKLKIGDDDLIKAFAELAERGHLRMTWLREYLDMKNVPDRCTLQIKFMPEGVFAPNNRGVDFGYLSL